MCVCVCVWVCVWGGGVGVYMLMWVFEYVCLCGCMYISRVPEQNGVSQAWYIVKIYHSGWKPSMC